MRRLEFFSQEVSEFNHITNTGHIGYLGVMDENDYPRIIPLNFVSIGGDIYFHGACEGEKYELMKKNPKSTFSVDLPYAFILPIGKA